MDHMMTALGLMSGTSMDGIDVALLTTDGEGRVVRGQADFFPYDAAFRGQIEQALADARQMSDRAARPGVLGAVEAELTRRHAEAVWRFLARHEGPAPELIGFHGQTVLHRPVQSLTVQLGDGQMLADETNLPVIFDMRAGDVANGGQGAPLVPAYHAALAKSLPPELAHFPICFVNVGGISNITYVPRDGEPLAFDTGPGNSLIDQWVHRMGGVPYDADGAIASEGGVSRAVVERYLAKPFFQQPGPKSLDRSDFTLAEAEGLDLADGARTLAAVTAEAIMAATAHLPERPRLWVVCGGGRRNPHIMADMHAEAAAGGAKVVSAEEAGLDGDATEAEAWAYLAVRARRGLPITFPGTTGCRTPTICGVLARPTRSSA